MILPNGEGRIEITKSIRVLHCSKPAGWAVWDDEDDECPVYSTKEKAIEAANQLASAKAFDRELEDEIINDPATLYEQADRATGDERKRLLKLAAAQSCI